MKARVVELECGAIACVASNGKMYGRVREHFFVASSGIKFCEKQWPSPENGAKVLMGNICRTPLFPDAEKFFATPEERNSFYEMMRLGLRVPRTRDGVPMPPACATLLGDILFADLAFDRAGIFFKRESASMLLVGRRADLIRVDWSLVDVDSADHYASCTTSFPPIIERHIKRFLALAALRTEC